MITWNVRKGSVDVTCIYLIGNTESEVLHCKKKWWRHIHVVGFRILGYNYNGALPRTFITWYIELKDYRFPNLLLK